MWAKFLSVEKIQGIDLILIKYRVVPVDAEVALPEDVEDDA